MSQEQTYFATTAKGMESLLLAEIASFGGKDLREQKAGVYFTGTIKDAYRVCLWSRVANRVLLPLKSFPAPNPEKLYGGVRAIRWSDHITPQDTLAVDFSSSYSEITHTHFGALKVKDAIVDQIRSVQGERPSVKTFEPSVRINVYLHENQATVSIDLSGESLHRRGYREEGSKAPLKENLAAAILMMADWPKHVARGAAFLDPMCGSGTLPIEAAQMATQAAPGLGRSYFGFLGWRGHDSSAWKELVADAQVQHKKALEQRNQLPSIVGYDEDFRSINVTLSNIEKAGMKGLVHAEKREFTQAEPLKTRDSLEGPKGIIILNPPYGERLGEVEELKPLYKFIGDTFKQKFKGWEGYVFTGSPDLAKVIGLKASRKFVLFNGPIECRLLKYDLY